MLELGKGKGIIYRADVAGTFELADSLILAGVQLAVHEKVGGMPKQSAPNAFVFGQTAMVSEAALHHSRIPYRMIPPTDWKKHFKLWGKGKDEAIALASQLIPHGRVLWTPRRGQVTEAQAEGRAEAALMALYARTLVSA